MQLHHSRLASLAVVTALNLMAASAASAAIEPPGNYDAYFGALAEAAARSARAVNESRLGHELVQGQLNERDPLMNRETFVWATATEPVMAVGPLTRKAQIDAQAREFLKRQAPAMGLDAENLDQAVAFDIQDLGRGPVIARYEQYVGGVPVFGRNLNVVLDRHDRPVAASGYFASGFDAAALVAQPFSIDAVQAVRSGFRQLGGAANAYAFVPSEFRDGYQWFEARPIALGDVVLTRMPRARAVWFDRGTAVEPAWYVELATDQRTGGAQLMHSFVFSATRGDLLFRNNLIAHATTTYRTFADPTGVKQPYDAPLGNEYTPFPKPNRRDPIVRTGVPTQLVTLDAGPISTGDPWLPATATTTTGNNVDACLDTTDTAASGVVVNPANTCVAELGDRRPPMTSPGVFDYEVAADSDPAPATAANAATVNLFYINNWLHDWWYDHGFNEAARNAQADNYGRGGAANDRLLAQGQDASGRNNANMGTPADGSSPTMQQYLFDGYLSGIVEVTAPYQSGALLFSGAAFGPDAFDVTNQVVLVADGAGVSPSDGCGAAPPNPTVPTPVSPVPQPTLQGRIALIDRGNCNFTAKAQYATSNGAVGMIVVQNSDADPITMGNGDIPVNAGATPSDPAYNIPAVMILRSDGNRIKQTLPAPVTAHIKRVRTVDVDGTLDNQIIAHEFFHYVSNRLINNSNGLTNQQGRGMGEGWGDIDGLMLSVRADDTTTAPDNDRWQGAYSLAWYVINNFYSGIRRVPMSTDFNKNAFTFKHIQDGVPTPDGGPGTTNSQVHSTGEIWANMVWTCYAGILNIPGRSFTEVQDRMKDYIIGGMKLTPASPTFNEARNGILASARATDYDDFEACARGFARRGAGVFAVSPPRANATNTGVTESYIALVEQYGLSRVDFIPDNPGFCDIDAILDSNETGVLELTFRNTGSFQPKAPVTATVSTTNGTVSFPDGGAIVLPKLKLGESVTVPLRVAAGDFAGSKISVPLAVTFVPPAPADVEIQYAPALATAFFANHDGGLRNLDDMQDASTSNADWTRALTGGNANAGWNVAAASATQGNGMAWFARDVAVVADATLTTPAFAVPAGGAFSMDFVHFFAFDTSGGTDWDGGVLEVEVDGGAWTDAIAFGASFTRGNGYNSTSIEAFNGRPGFGKTNTQKEDMTLSFGTLLGGRNVRLRFRTASDSSVAATGWYVDDVKLNGIAKNVFAFFADESEVCVQPVSVNAGADQDRPEHASATSPAFTVVTLGGTLTDPNDPDLAGVGVRWEQVAGPTVTLTGDTTLTPSFPAPSVAADTPLAFRLAAVSGEFEIASDDVAVLIRQVNLAPTVTAGPNQFVGENQLVTLNGSGTDVDGETVTLQWKQSLGPEVTLNDDAIANPTFTAPSLPNDTALRFDLTATDPSGLSATDSVFVTVAAGSALPVIGNTGVGGLPWWSLAVLGFGAALRRRKK